MSTKRKQHERKGIVQTGLDFAIGGTALAIDKASEVIHDAREYVEDAAEKAADEVKGTLSHKDTRPYEERTVEELRELASERDIPGRSRMDKAELITELRS